jgi:hypothetical protein
VTGVVSPPGQLLAGNPRALVHLRMRAHANRSLPVVIGEPVEVRGHRIEVDDQRRRGRFADPVTRAEGVNHGGPWKLGSDRFPKGIRIGSGHPDGRSPAMCGPGARCSSKERSRDGWGGAESRTLAALRRIRYG